MLYSIARTAITFFLLTVTLTLQAETLTGRVVGIADGDTLTILVRQHHQVKIRFSGIDAPEKTQAFGERSKQNLSRLAFGREAVIEWKKLDRYGRTVGKVLVDGQDIGLQQIRDGLAWHYKKYAGEQSTEDREDYAKSEEAARAGQRGLWVDANPVPPWDWRAAKRRNF